MTFLRVSQILVVAGSLFLLACDDTTEVATRSHPVVDTDPVSEVVATGATFNGEILNVGTTGIVDHGFTYDDHSNPMVIWSDTISLGSTTKTGKFSAFVGRNLEHDKQYSVRAYAITDENIVVYGQTVEFVSLGGSAPEFSDFTPKHGVAGATVIVIGSGFSNVLENNVVRFGTDASLIVKGTPDSLWCTVPGVLVPGEYQVSITVGDLTTTHPSKFLVEP